MKIKKILAIFCFTLFIILNSVNVFSNTVDTNNKIYTVGYYTNERPVQFIDSTQKASGISIEILKYLGEKSDIIFQFYPILDSNDIDFINTLDLNIASLNYVIDSDIFILQTNPYFFLELNLIGLSDMTDSLNKKIGIVDYLNIDEKTIFNILPDSSIYLFNNDKDLQYSLNNGDIDFAFMNKITAQDFFKYDTNNSFQSYPISIDLPFRILINKNTSDDTYIFLNSLLDELTPEILTDIILKFTPNILGSHNFMDNRNTYDYILVAHNCAIIILIITLFLFLISYLYRNHLDKMTFYDEVTGFFTEYKFNVEVIKVLKKAKPNEYSLVSIDIDNFQYVNEVYSFDIGTDILKLFSKYLVEYYPDGIFFTHIHSDNFLILVKNSDKYIYNDDKKMNDFSEENFDMIVGDYCHFYTSKGIYNIDNPKLPLTTLVGCVNLARSLGKSTYGNTSIVFTSQMNDKHATQNKILTNMERGLREKEFEVFYQPKIHLNGNNICGAEALIRWIPKNGDIIYPDEFIPLFEKNSYIIKLDFYVFEEVCQFISKNKDDLNKLVISVNISTITLLQNDLIEKLQELMEKYNVSINNIELEVTESAFVYNLDKVLSQIKSLKKIGFNIALDDFGSGISSLNQLKNIELDVIKLDKAFLSNSLNQDKGILIVENIIILAQKLNLIIVAEGVETEEDVSLLANLGCDIAQGYFFARPMTYNNFLNFLQKPI